MSSAPNSVTRFPQVHNMRARPQTARDFFMGIAQHFDPDDDMPTAVQASIIALLRNGITHRRYRRSQIFPTARANTNGAPQNAFPHQQPVPALPSAANAAPHPPIAQPNPCHGPSQQSDGSSAPRCSQSHRIPNVHEENGASYNSGSFNTATGSFREIPNGEGPPQTVDTSFCCPMESDDSSDDADGQESSDEDDATVADDATDDEQDEDLESEDQTRNDNDATSTVATQAPSHFEPHTAPIHDYAAYQGESGHATIIPDSEASSDDDDDFRRVCHELADPCSHSMQGEYSSDDALENAIDKATDDERQDALDAARKRLVDITGNRAGGGGGGGGRKHDSTQDADGEIVDDALDLTSDHASRVQARPGPAGRTSSLGKRARGDEGDEEENGGEERRAKCVRM